MESPRQKQNIVFMSVLAIMIVAATMLHKPSTLKFTDKIQNIDAESVNDEIAKSLGAGSNEDIYIKRLDATKKNNVIKNEGEPAFALTLYSDGSIYRMIFNIAYKGTNPQYTIYQVIGGSAEKKTNGGIVISKSGKLDEIGNDNIILKDILFSVKNINLKDIKEINGKSTLYTLKISGVYNSKGSLDLPNSKVYYLIDKQGKIAKLNIGEAATASKPLIMMPVYLSDNNGNIADSGVVLLVEVNK